MKLTMEQVAQILQALGFTPSEGHGFQLLLDDTLYYAYEDTDMHDDDCYRIVTLQKDGEDVEDEDKKYWEGKDFIIKLLLA